MLRKSLRYCLANCFSGKLMCCSSLDKTYVDFAHLNHNRLLYTHTNVVTSHESSGRHQSWVGVLSMLRNSLRTTYTILWWSSVCIKSKKRRWKRKRKERVGSIQTSNPHSAMQSPSLKRIIADLALQINFNMYPSMETIGKVGSTKSDRIHSLGHVTSHVTRTIKVRQSSLPI